ncbi:MAG: nuclear transport factor 2 family protein [Burkholderiales bacterium]|nr:MAG: nuclear transport factor 2 family protein [Burkholderiales bacterium]
MRTSLALGALLLLTMANAAGAGQEDPIIAQVMARDDELASAHGRGDMATYRAGLSQRYVYIDIGGQRVTADTLEARRENDQRRVVSSETSEQEATRLTNDVVMLRGLECSHASYFGGLPRISSSRWTALWVREDDGVWRLTAETATPVKTGAESRYIRVGQSDATLQALAGRWTLQLQPAMQLSLRVENGNLVGTLPGQAEQFVFSPASATHYFADTRTFELRFAADGESLRLLTWGTATAAVRTRE